MEAYTVACGARGCPWCGRLWEGDQRVRTVAASEHVGPRVALITVTAPGADVLPPDEDRGCVVRADAAREWNRTARMRWRSLHLAASKMARREDRRDGGDWRLLFRSWEYQARGVLHVHLVLPYGDWRERAATRRYVADLHALSPSFGFGFVLGGDRTERPSRRRPPSIAPAVGADAARYVCKYVCSVGGGKEGVQAVAARTATRGSVLYIAQHLTQASGVTMRSLRNRRRVVARFPWALDSPEDWESARLAHAATVGRPPLSQEARQCLEAAVRSTRATVATVAGEAGELQATDAATPPSMLPFLRAQKPRRRLVHLPLAHVLDGDPLRPELGPLRTVWAGPQPM